MTDGNSHTTNYTYNADNEQTKVEEPNDTITETEYDGAGQVISADRRQQTHHQIRTQRCWRRSPKSSTR